MRQFLQLCDRAGPRCAFSAGDPQAKWQALLARARRAPIPIPGGPPAGYADIVDRTVPLLADPPQSWAALARNLQPLYQASTPAAGTPTPRPQLACPPVPASLSSEPGRSSGLHTPGQAIGG